MTKAATRSIIWACICAVPDGSSHFDTLARAVRGASASDRKFALDPNVAKEYKSLSSMLSPGPGDVLIRDGVTGYTVVDAVSLRELSGPHPSVAAAFVAARSFPASHVWRENHDRRGRPLGDPFLLELQASTLA